METRNYSILENAINLASSICRKKAVSRMLFTVTWLIVLSFIMHINASASNDIKTTVTMKSVAQPTTYETTNETDEIDNIVSYRLSEIAGTEDITPEPCPEERDVDVFILDTSEEAILGSCEENNVIYDERTSVFVEEGSPNSEEKLYRYAITDDEYQILLRVVEAEVTGETFRYNGVDVSKEDLLKAKVRVAQVFLNRVEDTNKFSEDKSLKDALLRPGATSTMIDGRYYEVTVTNLTREAVEVALLNETEDYTDNALFFSSGTKYCAYGKYLFTDEVGHSFFR